MAAKANLPSVDFAVGCAVNAFFTVNCLVDLSFATWALNRSDLGTFHLYLSWKDEEIYLKTCMTVLLFGLPLALWKMFFGFLGAVRGHQASILRHVGDVGQFCTICVILFSVFIYLIPMIVRVKECSSEQPATATCLNQAFVLKSMQQYLLGLNILMLVWDILRFAGNSKEEPRLLPVKEIPKHH